MSIFVYGVRKCSNFILLHVVFQFSQHHLPKRLSFLHCIFLPSLYKVPRGAWVYLWAFYLVQLVYISIFVPVSYCLASLIAQSVTDLPAMQETQVRFLGRADPLEEEIATHSSTLAWKIPWTEKPGRLQSMGLQRVRHD